MDIVERIEQLRDQKGWDNSYLASQIGISRNAVEAWFTKPQSKPNRETIEKICETFKITLTEFYSEIDKDKLAAQEILLIEYFRKVQEESREQVLSILKSFIKE